MLTVAEAPSSNHHARNNMKLLLEPVYGVKPSSSSSYFDDESSSCSSCSEPNSPADSGFSSDDSIASDVSFTERFTRSKTLPSALRRSRSKQSEKRVRFADSLGLDLENLQYFVKEELREQKIIHFSSSPTSSFAPPALPPKQLINQPAPRLTLHNFAYCSENEYNEKTRQTMVCVSALRASGSSIVGQINLLNVAFDKIAVVRYTVDGWESFGEVVASYSHRMFACEDIDAFNFTIAIPVKLTEGKCEFCVQYQVAGREFWDNNNGLNYIVNVSMSGAATTSTSLLPRYGTKPAEKSRRHTGALPPVPCSRGSARTQQRRWGRSLDESDEEKEAILPARRATFH
uniref:Protein phosphatase 1 regulatory subunit n=2 Tax=Caenorhabditis japonica TaxID=281687 RepID=A0A8R1HQF1_CAEJA